MTDGLNRVQIIGNLGRDPEMRFLATGNAVTTLSVAATRSWKNNDGVKQEETEWFNVVSFGTLAELFGEHLTKGRRVFIEGRLKTRTWDDAEGVKHYKTEVVAERMFFMDSTRQPVAAGSIDPDDLPFE